ncbi:MAG: heavy-metal-associated domain-containing protein [Duodenibacillus sp.]|nr:heavy-metal-associated domain-containing protein [Duodenibacillus sp.]
MSKIKVDGMHCPNCQKRVLKVISALPGAQGVVVDLEKGEASWEAIDVPVEEVIAAVKALGFEAKTACCCGCGK